MNFVDVLPWLTFGVVMFTLAITLVGLSVARRASKEAAATEPWMLTKLDGDLWLLQRNTPVIATIHGIIVEDEEPLEGIEDIENLEDLPAVLEAKADKGFSFMNAATGSSKYFRKNTNVLLRIDPENQGHSFTLYYEEYKKMSKQPYTGYVQGMRPEDVRHSKVKSWTTDLY